MVLGVMVWVLVVPGALLVARNRPEDVGLYPDGANQPPPGETADALPRAHRAVDRPVDQEGPLALGALGRDDVSLDPAAGSELQPTCTHVSGDRPQDTQASLGHAVAVDAHVPEHDRGLCAGGARGCLLVHTDSRIPARLA